MKPINPDSAAWYFHFWPWFIVVLLGISVAGSLYTVSIAYSLGDLEEPADVRTPSTSQSAVDASEAAEH